MQVRRAIAAAIGAFALAAAFPKLGAAWIVPFGAASLFWAWQGASWTRAALLGLLAGLIYFSLDYAWVGFTVSHYVGPFGPVVPIAPALFEAPFFAAAGALAAVAYSRARPALAPLAAAAAFVVCDWARSVGVLGAPWDQLGYTQADGPLRAVAAFAGTYGITFALCVLGAYLADALHRRTWRTAAIAWGSVFVATFVLWLAWPARALPPPTITVAAIQGNIAQSLKWNNLPLAVQRYTSMTRQAIALHARLIVWPETVMTEALNTDPSLERRIGHLARDGNATVVAGGQEFDGRKFYDSLYIFAPDGSFATYRKRQLVPFAEDFPGEKILGWLPYVGSLSSRMANGKVDGVYPTAAGLSIAPMICWESAFADLAQAQMPQRCATARREHRRRVVRRDVGFVHARADLAAASHRNRCVRRARRGYRNQRHHRTGWNVDDANAYRYAANRNGQRRSRGANALRAHRPDDGDRALRGALRRSLTSPAPEAA